MMYLLKDRFAWILLGLLILTLLTSSVERFFPLSTQQQLGTLVIVFAFIKVRLILLYFMEAGNIYGLLRYVIETWILLAMGVTVLLYLYL